MRFKKAFTMAEAILVMVILGIIATIMISTMRPVEFRDRGFKVLAKKVLGQIDTATTQILFNNSRDSHMSELYAIGQNQTVYSFGANLTDTKDLYNTYLVGTREAVQSTWCSSGAGATMKLKDGSCLGFFSTGSYTNTNTWIPGERGPVAKNTGATDIGYITIDVNDEEEPNIFGKDWYTIPISANGINY